MIMYRVFLEKRNGFFLTHDNEFWLYFKKCLLHFCRPQTAMKGETTFLFLSVR